MTSAVLDRATSVRWPWVRLALLVNLISEVAIVVTGGLVRVTGSGLGCPTWPECVPGSFTPVVEQAEGYHKYIEFGNRTLTFVLGVAAIAVLVAVYSVYRRVTLGGALPLLLVIAQAVLGGITVRMNLSPQIVAAHLLLSMVTIAVSAWLWLRITPERVAGLASGDGLALPGTTRPLTSAIAVMSAVVLVLGTVVTGSGPHSGDADQPARFGFDPKLVSMIHSSSVWIFVGLTVALLVTLHRASAKGRVYRRAHWLFGLAVLQGGVGYLQYALGLPWPIVVVHMLLAGLFVVAVTALVEAVATERSHARP